MKAFDRASGLNSTERLRMPTVRDSPCITPSAVIPDGE
jgi:hypothetical protein